MPPAKQHARADQQSEEEAHGLLASRNSSSGGEAEANAAGSSDTATKEEQHKQAAGGSSGAADASKETGICRICLEEDLVSALEAPCACTGTQRHAHHACIQRWVDEKGNARCEICEQPYRGSYTVPPPPAAMPVDSLPLFTPMYILEASDPRHPYHQQRLDAMLDADHGLYQRNHSVSWCITFIIFFMFMVVLHHTLVVADGMDDPSGAAGAGGATPGASPDPSGGAAGGGGGGLTPGGDDTNVATDLLLFLFWLATKAFLIGIPLLAVMRIASRQAQREHYEAMLQAASQYETNSRRMVIRVRANPGSSSSNNNNNAAAASSSAAAGGSGTPGGAAAAGSGTQVAAPPPLATAV